jgi:hypothetical protein
VAFFSHSGQVVRYYFKKTTKVGNLNARAIVAQQWEPMDLTVVTYFAQQWEKRSLLEHIVVQK